MFQSVKLKILGNCFLTVKCPLIKCPWPLFLLFSCLELCVLYFLEIWASSFNISCCRYFNAENVWLLFGFVLHIFKKISRNLSFPFLFLYCALDILFKNFVASHRWCGSFDKYVSSKNLVFKILTLFNSCAFFIKKDMRFFQYHYFCEKVFCDFSFFNWFIPFNNETFGSDKATFFNFISVLFLLHGKIQGSQEIVTYWSQKFMLWNTICIHPYFVLFYYVYF